MPCRILGLLWPWKDAIDIFHIECQDRPVNVPDADAWNKRAFVCVITVMAKEIMLLVDTEMPPRDSSRPNYLTVRRCR